MDDKSLALIIGGFFGGIAALIVCMAWVVR